MGYSGQMYGRWTRFDVRRCAFMSILSGACAGITYGAAGIYSWHKVKKSFESSLGEDLICLSHGKAMSFTGAWDYGYIKAIFEELKVNSACKQDILINDTNDIQVLKRIIVEIAYIYVHIIQLFDYLLISIGECIKAVDLAEAIYCKYKNDCEEKLLPIDMHPFSQMHY